MKTLLITGAVLALLTTNVNAAGEVPSSSLDCKRYKSQYKPSYCDHDTPPIKGTRRAPKRTTPPPVQEHPLDIIPNFFGRLLGDVHDGLQTTVDNIKTLNPMEDD